MRRRLTIPLLIVVAAGFVQGPAGRSRPTAEWSKRSKADNKGYSRISRTGQKNGHSRHGEGASHHCTQWHRQIDKDHGRTSSAGTGSGERGEQMEIWSGRTGKQPADRTQIRP